MRPAPHDARRIARELRAAAESVVAEVREAAKTHVVPSNSFAFWAWAHERDVRVRALEDAAEHFEALAAGKVRP